MEMNHTRFKRFLDLRQKLINTENESLIIIVFGPYRIMWYRKEKFKKTIMIFINPLSRKIDRLKIFRQNREFS